MGQALEGRNALLEALAEIDEQFMETYLQSMEDEKEVKLPVSPSVYLCSVGSDCCCIVPCFY